MYTITFILTTIGLGLLWSIPGFAITKILARKGMVHDRPIIYIMYAIGVICVTFLLRRNHVILSWWIYGISAILMPLAGARNKLILTGRRGKWWWKKAEYNKTGLLDIVGAIIIYLLLALLLIAVLTSR